MHPMSTVTPANTCPVCTTTARFRLDHPDWTTDGTGHPTVEINGRTVHLCCRHQYESAIKVLDESKATVDAAGAIRWRSSGNIVPDDCLAMAEIPEAVRARCAVARTADTKAFFKRYRESGADVMGPGQLAEARAAHGPGVELVNVITGRRTRL